MHSCFLIASQASYNHSQKTPENEPFRWKKQHRSTVIRI